MKNISLKTLSITVVAASFISTYAFANNDLDTVQAKVEKPVSSFSQLLAEYDIDKNNTLSEKELASNETLTKIFARLDANGDQEISEAEFNQYLKVQ
ncbi:MAG: hypothetical protein ACPG52_11045 [Cognaticolwellia sp.]